MSSLDAVIHLEASSRAYFDFADARSRRLAYRIVLAEAGCPDDLTAWLDRDTLIHDWPQLLLPRQVRAALDALQQTITCLQNAAAVGISRPLC
jgi:hypothetical protein